jgi:hypothetical protein
MTASERCPVTYSFAAPRRYLPTKLVDIPFPTSVDEGNERLESASLLSAEDRSQDGGRD